MYYTSEVYYNRSLPNLLHKTKTSVTIYCQFVTDVVAKKKFQFETKRFPILAFPWCLSWISNSRSSKEKLIEQNRTTLKSESKMVILCDPKFENYVMRIYFNVRVLSV